MSAVTATLPSRYRSDIGQIDTLGTMYAAPDDTDTEPAGEACPVCKHPLRDDIDHALRRSGPDAYARTTASAFAPFAVHVLREHQLRHLDTPLIADQNSAGEADRRLETEGPPPGWFFCPECDSTNVRCKGSGYWKEDPGPVHWHVTECLDCGWP
jgi:hypothetical protein